MSSNENTVKVDLDKVVQVIGIDGVAEIQHDSAKRCNYVVIVMHEAHWDKIRDEQQRTGQFVARFPVYSMNQ